MRQGGTIRAYSSCEGMEHGLENETVVDYWLDKSSWKILSVSSEQSEGEGAARTIDGNPFTFWHTPYFPTVTPCPHEVVIDMSHAYQVAQFVYQGRSDSGNGRIKDYEVSFSNDPHTWGVPAITGTLLNTSAPQKVAVPGTPTARYMKLTVRSTHDNQGYATAAELGIMPVLNK